jgi:hypothetical protein
MSEEKIEIVHVRNDFDRKCGKCGEKVYGKPVSFSRDPDTGIFEVSCAEFPPGWSYFYAPHYYKTGACVQTMHAVCPKCTWELREILYVKTLDSEVPSVPEHAPNQFGRMATREE